MVTLSKCARSASINSGVAIFAYRTSGSLPLHLLSICNMSSHFYLPNSASMHPYGLVRSFSGTDNCRLRFELSTMVRWIPLISEYPTLPGNLCLNAMDLLKLLRYYLPLYTDSAFPPPERSMMYVFHATLLSSYRQTEAHGPSFSRPSPDLIDSEEEYKVNHIVSHKGSPGWRLYLTTWKGYPSSENTWEPELNFHHAPTILQEYKGTRGIT